MMDLLLQGHVTLTDDEGRDEDYEVLRVLEMEDRHYVLLMSLLEPEEEPLILRVEGSVEDDDASLCGIEDDEEWERVAEAFDTLMVEWDDLS
ncbi:hypothetical protein AYW79_14385 [Ferroacidibacillus organovorans]|uniref:UPF0473 protein AYW79_14385 n=2 Tax=Ferroacidibacillus organovorans TaxID=1765683 RepID=A0A162RYD9_9BACL|nr:hypothetical protein AYJ22_14990 [Ferroacidibacillus organovorans]OAG89935.1 hypothetical protein AYW79_14385 [Ferroacidibacillus organovorans]OPG17437.1 DUF1292 domain-containing protein [Ferroacidibacillus organovorans]